MMFPIAVLLLVVGISLFITAIRRLSGRNRLTRRDVSIIRKFIICGLLILVLSFALAQVNL